MSSLSYGGRDLSAWVAAEPLLPAALAMGHSGVAVPGSPGVVTTGADPAPLELVVRLTLDPRDGSTPAEARAATRAALLSPDGGASLRVPEQGALRWEGAVVSAATPWSGPGAGATCEVTFWCPDPVRRGGMASSAGESFEVGGTWPAVPTVEMVADGTCAPSVAVRGTWTLVRLGEVPAAGARVELDFAAQRAWVDDGDHSSALWLGSDFFRLGPGEARLSFEGCSSHRVRWEERWA